MERTLSGVGVLDKSVAVLDVVAAAPAGSSLAQLVDATGLTRATAHRLAVGLEVHGLLRRTAQGHFALGARLVGLGHAAAAGWPVAEVARPMLRSLLEATGESVQLYVRDGEHRVCVASLESPHELRTIVAEGARLPLAVGSAGRILSGAGPVEGWTASVEERAPGVASVSAPVVDARTGTVIAAVGISGPLERLGRTPGALHGRAVAATAGEIGRTLATAIPHDPAGRH